MDLPPTDTRLRDVLEVMCELRDHRTVDELVEMYRQGYRSGYRLAALNVGGRCQTVAGYRIVFNFALGSYLYVDDLVTRAEVRCRGYGEELLRHLVRRAREHDCTHVVLDSGAHRKRAHAFYKRNDLDITAYHFTLPVDHRA